MGGACLWCGDELVGGKMDGRFHDFFYFLFLGQGFWVLLVTNFVPITDHCQSMSFLPHQYFEYYI
jgi:hypothetical protein